MLQLCQYKQLILLLLQFCATRKGVQQAASVLAKDAKFIINTEQQQRYLLQSKLSPNVIVIYFQRHMCKQSQALIYQHELATKSIVSVFVACQLLGCTDNEVCMIILFIVHSDYAKEDCSRGFFLVRPFEKRINNVSSCP